MFWRVLGLFIAIGIVAFFLTRGADTTGTVDKGMANEMATKAKELRQEQDQQLNDAMKGM